jgi:DNA-binding NtrC family response regulator
MNKKGPIVIIEDDEDDRVFYNQIFKKLNYKNEIIYFHDGEEAFKHLISTSLEPFIIISDINMPKLNGLELRDKVHNNEDLKLKCIPYLFFTTSAEQAHVIEAYSKSIQGFFIKPNTLDGLEKIVKRIIEYWQDCVSPNYTIS